MADYKRKVEQLAFVDVMAVEIIETDSSGDTHNYRFKTSTSVNAEVTISEGTATQLIVNGVLIAQKKAIDTITGCEITLHDNVFSPAVIDVLQGGTFERDPISKGFKSYEAPKAGEERKVRQFTLNLYTAQRDQSGSLVKYGKISFPNCTGKPISLSFEEDTFFAPEYSIVSAPNQGAGAYKIELVDQIPDTGDEHQDDTP